MYFKNLDLVKDDKSAIETNIKFVQSDEKRKIEEKGKMNKEIEYENIYNAKQRQLEKLELRNRDSHEDLLHIEKIAKDLNENTKKYREIIKSKLSIVHNEERLMKLVAIKPKSLRDYETEANLKEKEQLLQIIQEENE